MKLASTHPHSHTPGALRKVDILAAGTALMIGLLAATLLVKHPSAADGRHAVGSGSMAAPPAAAADTSLPDASIVFAAAKLPADEAAPTF